MCSARFSLPVLSILPILLFSVAADYRTADAQAADDQAANPATAVAENTAATREYVVQPGDTLTRIAEKELGSASSVDHILALNPRLTDRHHIRFGDRILLPGAPRKSQSSANVGAGSAAPPESVMEMLRDFRDFALGLGLVGMGLTTILVVGAGIQILVYFLVGGLFLWLGAWVVRVPEVTFGRCFKVNAIATIVAMLVAVLLWAGVILLGFVDQVSWGSEDFTRFVILMILAYLVIQSLQILVYILSVRRGFDIGFLRSCFACFLAGLCQAVLGVVVGASLLVV